MIWTLLAIFAAITFAAWILLYLGISQRLESNRRNERERARTTGRIVGYVRREQRTGRRGGRRVYWRPVVEFTAEGRTLREEYENRMDREQFPEGAEVEVLYSAGDPACFHLVADPVFVSGGSEAIRVALVWILAAAVLTILLSLFIGAPADAPAEPQRFFQGSL